MYPARKGDLYASYPPLTVAEYASRSGIDRDLARKKLGAETRIGKDSKVGMSFLGFILFSDPPKPGIEALLTFFPIWPVDVEARESPT